MSALGYVPFSEYVALDACNASFLKAMLRSPMHARHAQLHGYSTPTLELGSALHAAVLEPSRYAKDFAVAPLCDRRTKAGKAQYLQFCDDFPGATILSGDMKAQVDGMHTALVSSKEARKWLVELPGSNECAWTWERDGLVCKCRPDRVVGLEHGVNACVDLKSCRDATERAFQRAVVEYGYHISAAWYADGLIDQNVNIVRHILVCVESEPPHGVAVYELDVVWLDAAAQTIARLWPQYVAARKSGVWEGYPDTVQHLTAPAWMEANNE